MVLIPIIKNGQSHSRMRVNDIQTFKITTSRLEMLQRSLQWARLIDDPAADQLLSDLDEYVREVRMNFQSAQQGEQFLLW